MFDNDRQVVFKFSIRLSCSFKFVPSAEVAQSVEQETENLCVGGSIPSLGILFRSQFYSRNKLRWRGN